MGELINKISSYKLFNYLFPGAVFVALLNVVTSFNLIQENMLVGTFLYYFIGMVISRIGSLVVEPLMKKIKVKNFKLLHFSDYNDYVAASKSEEKIEELSEANNTYRTLVATFLVLLLAMLFDFSESKWNWLGEHSNWVGLLAMLILFIFSYHKQTNYIRKRVEKHVSKGE